MARVRNWLKSVCYVYFIVWFESHIVIQNQQWFCLNYAIVLALGPWFFLSSKSFKHRIFNKLILCLMKLYELSVGTSHAVASVV
jgi:hypothetical protein